MVILAQGGGKGGVAESEKNKGRDTMDANPKTETGGSAAERGEAVRWTAFLPWVVAMGALAAMHGAGLVERHERVMVDTLVMTGCGMAATRCRGDFAATLGTTVLCAGVAALLWLFPAG